MLPLHRLHRVADERPPLHGAELLGGGATQALPAPARRQHNRHRRAGGPGVAAPAAGLHLRGALLRSSLSQRPSNTNAAGTALPPARFICPRRPQSKESNARPPPAGTGPCSSPTPRYPRPRRGVRARARPGSPAAYALTSEEAGGPPRLRLPVRETEGAQCHKWGTAAIGPLSARRWVVPHSACAPGRGCSTCGASGGCCRPGR